jgi:hypothetical protein
MVIFVSISLVVIAFLVPNSSFDTIALVILGGWTTGLMVLIFQKNFPI